MSPSQLDCKSFTVGLCLDHFLYFFNMIAPETKEYILVNRNSDVRKLALGKHPAGVDMKCALTQISGWQVACQKVPLWADNPNVEYPVHLSLEQCTNQSIAEYKANIVNGILPNGFSMVDLTGGMGIDCYFISAKAGVVIYNEMNPDLCALAQNNFQALGRPEIKISNQSAEEFISHIEQSFDLIYLDPARRGDAGKKLVSISDCQPDVTVLQSDLLKAARYVLVKLSPMLDIAKALSELSNVLQITAISLAGECKELLVLMSSENHTEPPQAPIIQAVNIDRNGQAGPKLEGTRVSESALPLPVASPDEIFPGKIIYEPFAAHMKSGLYRTLAANTGTKLIHPMTHLYMSDVPVSDFPGRAFEIRDVIAFSGKGVDTLKKCKANVACRNFPMTPEELKKRFKISDGGDRYLFATTVSPETKVILDTVKVIHPQSSGEGSK